MTVVSGLACLANLCARNRSRVARYTFVAAEWRVAWNGYSRLDTPAPPRLADAGGLWALLGRLRRRPVPVRPIATFTANQLDFSKGKGGK